MAEAASGAAMLGVFGDVIDDVIPLARSAHITCRRPGLGALTATAVVDEAPEAILARFAEKDCVDFTVIARVEDAAEEAVATATVKWHVRRGRFE